MFLAKNWLSMADRPEVQVITNVNISGPFGLTAMPRTESIITPMASLIWLTAFQPILTTSKTPCATVSLAAKVKVFT
jgi:hypothetical protein